MRILIADDSPEVRSALRLVLEQQAGHRVSGESPDAINLLAQAARHCPEVVILDTELSGIQPNGRPALRSLVELVETLHLLCPHLRVIALSSRPNRIAAGGMPQADAVLCKSDPPDALLALLENFHKEGKDD